MAILTRLRDGSFALVNSLGVVEQTVDQLAPSVTSIRTLRVRDESVMVKCSVQFHANLLSRNIHLTWSEPTNDQGHARIVSWIGDVLNAVVAHQFSGCR